MLRAMSTSPPVNHPPTLSIDATAARLGRHRRTVDRYIARGLLVARRDPATRRVGIELASVEAIEQGRVVLWDALPLVTR